MIDTIEEKAVAKKKYAHLHTYVDNHNTFKFFPFYSPSLSPLIVAHAKGYKGACRKIECIHFNVQ